MWTHRKAFRGPISCVVAFAFFLVYGCGPQRQSPEAKENVGHQRSALIQTFDGATLFSGLFFGTGPVAAYLSDIENDVPSTAPLSQEDRERLANRLDQMAATLRPAPGTPAPAAPPQAVRSITATSYRPADTYGNRGDGPGACGSYGVCNYGDGISFNENGDWVRYRGVDFGSLGGYGVFSTLIATPNSGGHVQLFVDGVPSTERIARKADENGRVEPPFGGRKIADIATAPTSTTAGDFSVFRRQATSLLLPASGVHDIYVLFVKKYVSGTTGTALGVGNIKDFELEPTVTPSIAADQLSGAAQSLIAGGQDADTLAGQIQQAATYVRSNGTPPAAALAQAQIVDRIRSSDSEFFDGFAGAIQSGDVERIDAALLEGSRWFTRIIAEARQNGLPGLTPFPSEGSGRFVGDDTDGTDTDTSTVASADDSASSDTSTDTDSVAAEDDSRDTSTDTNSADDTFTAVVQSSDDTYVVTDNSSATDNSRSDATDSASAADTSVANQAQVANYVQLYNAVQLTNAVQVHFAFEFAVFAVVFIVVAAFAAFPHSQRLQTARFATQSDPLERELLVNAIATRLHAAQ